MAASRSRSRRTRSKSSAFTQAFRASASQTLTTTPVVSLMETRCPVPLRRATRMTAAE
ncbi:hypothetical protein [Corallococcus sp. EGB]|uniref:hypothetical protein n=1 Tax=Corallococcus sp. EGB TaxID=1521117 RepID=UPI001CBCC08F|nr:hypothetical protein [Corallococcus sp. EGB]